MCVAEGATHTRSAALQHSTRLHEEVCFHTLLLLFLLSPSSSLTSFGFLLFLCCRTFFSLTFLSVFLLFSFHSLFTFSSRLLSFFLSFGIFTSLYLQFYFITHSSSCSSRSRLSWGQMLGCYAHSGLTVCGLELGERSSGLQSSWLPQCLAPKAPRRHLYPVAFLLVTSHLLVLWLILSLVILLAKYQ